MCVCVRVRACACVCVRVRVRVCEYVYVCGGIDHHPVLLKYYARLLISEVYYPRNTTHR